eukprot:TRINITY_DN3253_c0_g1_i2.p1 TRINITY_DN3253_c0_g1~~TRINITY_DN3253_c0_g1_i2.p1  ORF type:complete len:222 (+),score=66.24 TRINITY_DN3253_c0_g1_i2:85-666(+)
MSVVGRVITPGPMVSHLTPVYTPYLGWGWGGQPAAAAHSEWGQHGGSSEWGQHGGSSEWGQHGGSSEWARGDWWQVPSAPLAAQPPSRPVECFEVESDSEDIEVLSDGHAGSAALSCHGSDGNAPAAPVTLRSQDGWLDDGSGAGLSTVASVSSRAAPSSADSSPRRCTRGRSHSAGRARVPSLVRLRSSSVS